MNLDPYLTIHTKINSKCIIDLTVRVRTIKLLNEHIGINLCELGLGHGFLDMIPKAQATKERVNWTPQLTPFGLLKTPPSM